MDCIISVTGTRDHHTGALLLAGSLRRLLMCTLCIRDATISDSGVLQEPVIPDSGVLQEPVKRSNYGNMKANNNKWINMSILQHRSTQPRINAGGTKKKSRSTSRDSCATKPYIKVRGQYARAPKCSNRHTLQNELLERI